MKSNSTGSNLGFYYLNPKYLFVVNTNTKVRFSIKCTSNDLLEINASLFGFPFGTEDAKPNIKSLDLSKYLATTGDPQNRYSCLDWGQYSNLVELMNGSYFIVASTKDSGKFGMINFPN